MSFGGLPLTFLTVPLRKKEYLSYRVHVFWRLASDVLDWAVKKKGQICHIGYMSFGGLPLTILTVPYRKKANLSYRVHVLWRLASDVLDWAVKKKGKSVISGTCPLEACLLRS